MKGTFQHTDTHMQKLQKLLCDMKQIGNEIYEKRENENKHLDRNERKLKGHIEKRINDIRGKMKSSLKMLHKRSADLAKKKRNNDNIIAKCHESS